MEIALREVCKDIRIGKILIQTDPRTSEPMVGCVTMNVVSNDFASR